MKEQLKNTTKTVKQVRAHAVANEQYSRKSNIKILGLPENKELEKVDSKTLVLDFLKEKLDIDLDIGEVDAAHRTGKPDKNRNRSLTVCFLRRENNYTVMRARKKLKRSGIVIVDDLCKGMQELFNRIKQDTRVKSAWTWDGKVYMIRKNNGEKKKSE